MHAVATRLEKTQPKIRVRNSSFRPQPKLTIGAVNDPAEAEADRVADQVMRMPAQKTSSPKKMLNLSLR